MSGQSVQKLPFASHTLLKLVSEAASKRVGPSAEELLEDALEGVPGPLLDAIGWTRETFRSAGGAEVVVEGIRAALARCHEGSVASASIREASYLDVTRTLLAGRAETTWESIQSGILGRVALQLDVGMENAEQHGTWTLPLAVEVLKPAAELRSLKVPDLSLMEGETPSGRARRALAATVNKTVARASAPRSELQSILVSIEKGAPLDVMPKELLLPPPEGIPLAPKADPLFERFDPHWTLRQAVAEYRGKLWHALKTPLRDVSSREFAQSSLDGLEIALDAGNRKALRTAMRDFRNALPLYSSVLHRLADLQRLCDLRRAPLPPLE
jgi:hypothetical protein